MQSMNEDIAKTIHNCKGYRGLKWWQLLFSRKQWRNGVYEKR